MPLPATPDIVKHCDYLYERTAGCIGILRDWLSEAYAQALDESTVTTLTLHHLEENVPFSSERAHKMHNRIANDEKEFLKEFSDDDTDVPQVKTPTGESTKDAPNKMPKHKRRNRRVGERAPARDDNGMSKRNATSN